MKRNKVFVAITGGIGSGKSSAAKFIREKGYPVISADTITQRVYSEPEISQALKFNFPRCVSESGIDRKELAAEAFSDPMKLKKLEAVTHPIIMKKLFREMEQYDEKFIFAEVPLLFENGYETYFDEVIVLMRSRSKRIDAVKSRDGLSDKEIISRIENQYDYEKKPIIGHTVIYNDGELSALEKQICQVVNEIETKYAF